VRACGSERLRQVRAKAGESEREWDLFFVFNVQAKLTCHSKELEAYVQEF